MKRLIVEGRVHRRTVVHKEASNQPEVVTEFAREVAQFLKDARIELKPFVRELSRLLVGGARGKAGRSGR